MAESEALSHLHQVNGAQALQIAALNAQNNQLRSLLDTLRREMDVHNRRAASTGETYLNYGGPGS